MYSSKGSGKSPGGKGAKGQNSFASNRSDNSQQGKGKSAGYDGKGNSNGSGGKGSDYKSQQGKGSSGSQGGKGRSSTGGNGSQVQTQTTGQAPVRRASPTLQTAGNLLTQVETGSGSAKSLYRPRWQAKDAADSHSSGGKSHKAQSPNEITVAGTSKNEFKLDFDVLPDAAFRCAMIHLPGSDCARLSVVCSLWNTMLGDKHLWNEQVQSLNVVYPILDESAKDRFQRTAAVLSMKQIRWVRLRQRGLYPKEGCPWMFLVGSNLVVYGGFGYGPETTMHFADVSCLKTFLTEDWEDAPLHFQQLPSRGRPTPPSYNQTCTKIEENVVVAVGGFLRGGYHVESPEWAVGTISSSEDGPVVTWDRPGSIHEATSGYNNPTPRGGHSATHIPADFCDPQFPNGLLFVFGGNSDREPSNSVDILDLATWRWVKDFPIAGPKPEARNSHSATLVINGKDARVVIVGGGNGPDVPRAGVDFNDAAIFNPRRMCWEQCMLPLGMTIGRAHTAVKVGQQIVVYGGGRMPSTDTIVIDLTQEGLTARRVDDGNAERRGTRSRQSPVSFHGSLSLLPLGVPFMLFYGGWHPQNGTSGEIWMGKLDYGAFGTEDDRFGQRSPQAAEVAQPPDDRLVQLPNGMVIPLHMLVQLMQMQRGGDAQDDADGDDVDDDDDDDAFLQDDDERGGLRDDRVNRAMSEQMGPGYAEE